MFGRIARNLLAGGALLACALATPALSTAAVTASDSLSIQSPQAVTANGWALLPAITSVTPPTRFTHTIVHDTARHRGVLFGGSNGFALCNDVWTIDLDASGAWKQVTPAGTPPQARRLHSAVYDPIRDRMLVFGGEGSGLLNDVWELVFSGETMTWNPLTVSGPLPPARSDCAMMYDPNADRVVVFGGYDGSLANRRGDLWQLSLSGTPHWSPLSATGTPPPGRSGQRATYDSARHRMLMYGGYDTAIRSDVWALTLTGTPQWTLLAPAGIAPAGRADHVVDYDATGDRLIICGGYDGIYGFNDIGSLKLSGTPTWTVIPSVGSPAPVANFGQAGFWDGAHSQLFVHGGYGANTSVVSPAVPGGSWTYFLGPVSIWYPRQAHSGVYDGTRRRMLAIAGGYSSYYNDVLELGLDGASRYWRTLQTAPVPRPSPRRHQSVVLDSDHDRLVLFGGFNGTLLQDAWQLPLGGGPLPAWAPLGETGPPPSPRSDFSMIFDPVGHRAIVFGGYDGLTGAFGRLGDLWSLSLTGTPAWTPLAATGTPPSARSGHRAIYDPLRHRMLLVGGFDGAMLNDVWELSLVGTPKWTLLTPDGGTLPVGRADHLAVYDDALDRMLVFGGYDGYEAFGDLWAFSLGGAPHWSLVAPNGSEPSYLPAGIFDPVRKELIVHGGITPFGISAYTWIRVDDAPTPALASLASAEVSDGVVRIAWQVDGLATGDLAIERGIESSGDWLTLAPPTVSPTGLVSIEDANAEPGVRYHYRLRWRSSGVTAGETAIEVPLGNALQLLVRASLVQSGAVQFDCRVTGGRAARLDVLDLAGRVVATRDLGVRPAGSYIELVPASALPAAGVYFARLRLGDQARVARFVLAP